MLHGGGTPGPTAPCGKHTGGALGQRGGETEWQNIPQHGKTHSGPSENAPRSIVGALQADAQAKGSCRIAMKMNKAGEERTHGVGCSAKREGQGVGR